MCVDLALVETLLYSVRVCVSVWVFVSAWVCVCMYECVSILLSHCAARDVPIYLHSVCVFVAHIMYAYMYTFIYVNVSIHFAYCVCVFRASFRIISVHIFTHASHQVGSLRDRFPRTVSIIAVTDDVYLCTLFFCLSVRSHFQKKNFQTISLLYREYNRDICPSLHPSQPTTSTNLFIFWAKFFKSTRRGKNVCLPL